MSIECGCGRRSCLICKGVASGSGTVSNVCTCGRASCATCSGRKISSFPATTTLSQNARFSIVQDGQNETVTYGTLSKSLNNSLIDLSSARSTFTSLSDRDEYFSVNYIELEYDLPITVTSGDLTYIFKWTELDNPVQVYDSSKWQQASLSVPSGSIELGAINLNEGGDHAFIHSNLDNRNAFVLDRALDDDTGSLDPVSERLGPLETMLIIDLTGVDVPIVDGQQFEGGSGPDINGYQGALGLIAKKNLVNFYLIGRWESHTGQISVVSEVVNHTVIDTENGDPVTVKFKNLTKIDPNKNYYTTLYMDASSELVGGVVPAGGQAAMLSYANVTAETILPYQEVIGYNVLEVQSLLHSSSTVQIEDHAEAVGEAEIINIDGSLQVTLEDGVASIFGTYSNVGYITTTIIGSEIDTAWRALQTVIFKTKDSQVLAVDVSISAYQLTLGTTTVYTRIVNSVDGTIYYNSTLALVNNNIVNDVMTEVNPMTVDDDDTYLEVQIRYTYAVIPYYSAIQGAVTLTYGDRG